MGLMAIEQPDQPVNTFSSKHHHEPGFAPVLDPEGRCLMCQAVERSICHKHVRHVPYCDRCRGKARNAMKRVRDEASR